MATAMLIRAHIAALGDEQIFTFREFFSVRITRFD